MLVSAEALVRWKHSELGMISPGEFIPLFERTGRISELDIHVWREAARQIATWRDKYGKDNVACRCRKSHTEDDAYNSCQKPHDDDAS